MDATIHKLKRKPIRHHRYQPDPEPQPQAGGPDIDVRVEWREPPLKLRLRRDDGPDYDDAA